jgi:hypothetical protein
MGGQYDSGRPERRLSDAAAKARFLEALRSGAPREAAAEAAGFPLKSFYNVRARGGVFRLAWEWMIPGPPFQGHQAGRRRMSDPRPA